MKKISITLPQLTMNTRESFGRKIVEKRNIMRITQQELASRAGITRNNLSRIENGKYPPTLDTIIKIATVLKLQLTFIEIEN